jgi:GTP-binding protein
LGFTELDLQLLGFIAPRIATGQVRLLALLTKADKLNRADAQRALHAAQDVLADLAHEPADVGIALFSALSRQGVGDVAQTLKDWAP